jgi:hypothetical protein
MDAITHGIIAVVTAASIALAALFGTSATQSPQPKLTDKVQTISVVICGQGGIVPPNADGTPAKKCNK